jgi:hypothetical protein
MWRKAKRRRPSRRVEPGRGCRPPRGRPGRAGPPRGARARGRDHARAPAPHARALPGPLSPLHGRHRRRRRGGTRRGARARGALQRAAPRPHRRRARRPARAAQRGAPETRHLVRDPARPRSRGGACRRETQGLRRARARRGERGEARGERDEGRGGARRGEASGAPCARMSCANRPIALTPSKRVAVFSTWRENATRSPSSAVSRG